MKSLKIQVADEIASKIEQAANDRGISIEDLLQISVEEKIQRDIHAEGWDHDIERDAASGKLDKLFARSIADHRAGKSREI
jgi:hypothetical protein